MARISGTCTCVVDPCVVHEASSREDWVDKLTGHCRGCEVEHGDRWGHHGAKAEQPTPEAGERSI